MWMMGFVVSGNYYIIFGTIYNRVEKRGRMALSIKDAETERLARAVAERTGETITGAIRRALADRLNRLGSDTRKAALLEDLAASRRRWGALPKSDARKAEEIIGYDEYGLPG